ncbi:MAG TPA: ISL3 family transposase [Noviherbaspirillum sp.]
MTNDLFAAALGLQSPWFVPDVQFDEAKRQLTIRVNFPAGTRFAVEDVSGEHPVHDTQIKRLRHLNFFQHECHLEVRVPRVRLPDGSVRLVDPPWAGRLSGFTLLFEALVLALCREMPFAAVARMVGLSWHRVHAICTRYVELAMAQMDLSDVYALAIDETSCRRGHDYVTLVVDMAKRRVVFVTEGRDNACIARFKEHLEAHGGNYLAIETASIDMSPAFIKGVEEAFPLAEITFDKFHVIAQASAAVDATRRAEQKTDSDLKGMRWLLLKDRDDLTPAQRADLDALVAQAASRRTARAWLYREQLRAILERKQINVMSTLLRRWCSNVMRSKVEPMKNVAAMIRRHFDGVVAWARTRQTNGLIEAINGLFQAAKRKARGFVRFSTMRTVLFLIAGKLDFSAFNPHASQLT